MAQCNWRDELGTDFDVPPEIENEYEDRSWHNDAAVNFGIKDRENVILWVDHPEPAQRECGGKRFAIVVMQAGYGSHSETLLHTDDLDSVLQLMSALSKMTDELISQMAAALTAASK